MVGAAATLRRRGIDFVEVVPIDRINWLKVLRGVGDVNFWRGDAQPDGPAFKWYLEVARATVEKAVAARKKSVRWPTSLCGGRVVLVCHSAGGWLARALCLDEAWALEHVRGIVTLGAPHLGPPSQVLDQTRGTVTNLNRRSPGAYLRPQLFYVTVASGRILGDISAPGAAAKTAFNSYRMICGNGSVVGDGIVPLNSAHLDGAKQVNINCFHSVVEPGTSRPTDEWYAAEPFIDEWLRVAATELRRQTVNKLLHLPWRAS